MADTWRYYAPTVSWTPNKNLLDIWNGASSSKTISVYRMFVFNLATTVTGVLDFAYIYRFTDSTAPATTGSAITGYAHRSNNTALNANTLGGTGYTANITTTAANMLRRFIFATKQAVAGNLNYSGLETLVPFAMVWDSGYSDASTQPLTCVAGAATGYVVVAGAGHSAGTTDLEIEFTSE